MININCWWRTAGRNAITVSMCSQRECVTQLRSSVVQLASSVLETTTLAFHGLVRSTRMLFLACTYVKITWPWISDAACETTVFIRAQPCTLPPPYDVYCPHNSDWDGKISLSGPQDTASNPSGLSYVDSHKLLYNLTEKIALRTVTVGSFKCT
jgi:hypothetical protein